MEKNIRSVSCPRRSDTSELLFGFRCNKFISCDDEDIDDDADHHGDEWPSFLNCEMKKSLFYRVLGGEDNERIV